MADKKSLPSSLSLEFSQLELEQWEDQKQHVFDKRKHLHSEACCFWFNGCELWACEVEKAGFETGGYFNESIGLCNYGNDF